MRQSLKRIVASILTAEAKRTLARYEPSVVAVTGSVGKTTTKDAIFAVFSAHAPARKSDKSFNSELGVPLTVLGLPNAWRNPFGWSLNIIRGALPLLFRYRYPRWLVLEVGADRPGDIRSIAAWTRPRIAVLTLLPDVPVHVEYFDSPEAVAREKISLAEAVGKDGWVVANADDPAILDALHRLKSRSITYGFSRSAVVRADEYSVVYEGDGDAVRPVGIRISVFAEGVSIPVALRGALGRQHAYPLLAALAAAQAAGFDLRSAAEALSQHMPPPGRMRVLPGKKGATIVDDSYNSSPAALRSALEAVSELRIPGKKILALGDMLELGKYSVAEHAAAGAAASFADVLVTVGPRARDIASAAVAAGMDHKKIFQFAESKKAALYLEHVVSEGDVVLVKGSQGTRMERVSAALLAPGADAAQNLVRQERAWHWR